MNNRIIFSTLALTVTLLGLASCGKGHPEDNLPDREIIYKKSLVLTSPTSDLKGHLIIKDNAMLRFAQGIDLEGSFSLGDDYRYGLKKTLLDKAHSTLTVPYEVTRLNTSSFDKIQVALGEWDMWQNNRGHLSIEKANIETLRSIEESLSQARQSLKGNLVLQNRNIERSKYYFIDTSQFVENGLDSLEHQRSLHTKQARIYMSSSFGEEVFYVKPGLSIIAFLKKHFGRVVLAEDGTLRELGKDRATISSRRELIELNSNTNPAIWIQHPQTLDENDRFIAGNEYIFIHTSKDDILRFLKETVGSGLLNDDRNLSDWGHLSLQDHSIHSGRGVIYNRALKLQTKLHGREDFSGHLVIKDKAIYKFARNLPLRNSFSLGDDYRISLNPTYINNKKVDFFKETASHIRYPYRVSLPSSATAPVKGMAVSFKQFDFETNQFYKKGKNEEEASDHLLRQSNGQDFVLNNDEEEYLKDFVIPSDRFDTSKLNILEISSFLENENYSQDLLTDLYSNYARLYISTPQKEEVYYISPGVNIVDFLREHFGKIQLSLDGQLEVLGEVDAEHYALHETTDRTHTIWIQYPSKLRTKDTFTAGDEYIFIHTNRAEILSHTFGNSVIKKPLIRFEQTYSLPLDTKDIYIAKINLHKKHSYIEIVRGPYIGPKGEGIHTVDFGFLAIEKQRVKEDLISISDTPQIKNGLFGSAGGILQENNLHFYWAEIIPDAQANPLVELIQTKKKERVQRGEIIYSYQLELYHLAPPSN